VDSYGRDSVENQTRQTVGKYLVLARSNLPQLYGRDGPLGRHRS